ncbi:MAG TPA: sigma-70 family RNA polymerase sigma factor [Candidatus Omnitrophota bacterium]|nr:sigma-70 family RNA polymerase sigma factor [Candidatus Omnitrophota bacterium]
MKRSSYRGLFEDWEVGVAKNIVDEHKRNWKCLAREDFDDLLQESLLFWSSVKDGYDPAAGASKQTYMSRVLKRNLRNIIESLLTDKRKVAFESISLNQPLSDEEDASSLLDILADDQNHAIDLRVHAELSIDISNTIKSLTPRQRELCRLLKDEGLSVPEAGEVLSLHRSNVYREIERIKEVFQKKKLNEYF